MRPCFNSDQRAYFKSVWMSELLKKNTNDREMSTRIYIKVDVVHGCNLGNLQTHGVETHISGHGSVELVRSDQERNGLGHLFGVQRNGSRALCLLPREIGGEKR